MRHFDAEYLRATRRGMWADSREALADLALGECGHALDVGCGEGALTRVLREESGGTVVGCDRDARLLAELDGPTVRGDAYRLPFVDGGVDLVACQALLINLSDPERAVREFARVAADRVACIEPDNGAVGVESTVETEADLARRVIFAYPATQLLVEKLQTLHEDGFDRPTLVELVRYLHEVHPTFTVELFLRGDDDVRSRALTSEGDLRPAPLREGRSYHAPTVFQLKAMLYHTGILTERGAEPSNLDPTADVWALRQRV